MKSETQEYEAKARQILLKEFKSIMKNVGMDEKDVSEADESTMNGLYSKYWGLMTLSMGSLNKTKTAKGKERITIESLVHRRLLELKDPYKEKELIRFPDVFGKICTLFAIPKEVAFVILQQLEDEGLIEIVPHNGIRI